MAVDEALLKELEALYGARLRYLVPVREPLVLISQVQRSGGTLLSQLFDGHPQVHAHPHELKIGYPKRQTWPPLDLAASSDTWFEILRESKGEPSFRNRYRRPGRARRRELGSDGLESFPFLIPPSLQRRIFGQCVEAGRVERERDILDAYLTSYFNAWLDNHNLYSGPKRIVTGFTPRLAWRPENLVKFFGAYPDGKLLTLVRHPGSWFVSARKHNPTRFGQLDEALRLWLKSTGASIAAKDRYGDRVLLLHYNELVDDLSRVMERVASRLGIDFVPALLTPTFNTLPIQANSSFDVPGHGIIREPLERQRDLSAVERREIEQRTRDVYEQALARKS